MDINRNNYESFFLLYLDRELKPDDMQSVDRFLSENADLQKEFSFLQQTIQVPVDIVFEPKESLMHAEENRRIVPYYRMRIAAAIAALILCSWLIKMQFVKNRTREVAGTIQPVEIKKGAAKPAEINKNGANQTSEAEVAANMLTGNHNKSDKDGRVVNGRQKDQPVVKGGNKQKAKNVKPEPDQQNPNADDIADAPGPVLQKSSADLRVQSAETLAANSPEQVSSLPGISGQALLVSAGHNTGAVKAENTVLKEADYQTEDAISVVALNDRNKTITGFFKKLVNRAPADDNARKLRISVFQISY